ncbi:hypothetical protein CK556_03540 [Mesoplasma chauliocola]|uniref:Uncharacterized protein n=1 Tax=Mesoplasma chauliocola TaxID=216427 RepID=A0A249SP84_9MOLU|nr:hypothetical protein [Mesoplasma chauliocola]ASZ09399.1 hypothetical protein CK556_03540 [Mesoplasma chauliocola]
MFKMTKGIKAHKHFIKSRKKHINKWLKEHGLTDKEAKDFASFTKENILLKVYLNIVIFEGKNRKNFVKEMIYITLYSRILYQGLEQIETKKSQIEKIKLSKIIENLTLDHSEFAFEKINFEKEIFNQVKEFSSFNDEILNKRRNFFYQEIGLLFSKITEEKKQIFYAYGYLLSLYVITYFETDIEQKNNTFNNLLFKLRVNEALCDFTKEVNEFHFNTLIAKINRWLKVKSKSFSFKEGG